MTTRRIRPDALHRLRWRPDWDRETIFATLSFWGAGLMFLLLVQHVTQPPFQWDRAALAWASRIRGPFSDLFFQSVTWLGSLWVLGPLALFACRWFYSHNRFGDAWLFALGLAGASGAANIAKGVFHRSRPDFFAAIGSPPEGLSFPSGHAVQITAFLTAYLLSGPTGRTARPRSIALAAAAVAAVGFSRVYLQVHHPSDVIAGAGFGLLWVLGLDRLLRSR